AQHGNVPAMEIAHKLLAAGVQTVLITMAEEGCLGVQGEQAARIYAPKMHVVDGCGAGATFSAGYIFGYLRGWSLLESLRFATAAASLKVTRPGLKMFPVAQIQELAAQLRAEQTVPTDDAPKRSDD
ncbi:MAG: hypothetical protein FIA98_02605, partial [Anaerolineae bacterium]|nr:hypothetical protein [Anaerolineae bacterium]